MSIRHWRAAPGNLARVRLVLAQVRARRGWVVWCALVVAALLAGAAGSHLYWRERLAPLQRQVVALKELQQLQQGLEQSRLQLRVSEARGHELERQIDALNQRLRESQDELTFYRKTRDAKR
ncbi:MAG: hypothetical protein KGK18_09250 [Burkholderiales bacterium]|nr:hypothetical protein [Burkholderiales bacterium]